MLRMPYLKPAGTKKILFVQDSPMILLAGEVHNSNASSTAAMEPVWQKARSLGLNCLLLPVSWEMVEPVEGCFEFSLVDQLIEQARDRQMKIVFLWFGSWKNAECRYAPAWVKMDPNRFPRAELIRGQKACILPGSGRPYTTLSYLDGETQQADAKAFAALMSHIRNVDEISQTVVAMQVENETGLLGYAREHSDRADAVFTSSVPTELVAYMKNNAHRMDADIAAALENGEPCGSWADVFGPVSEEVFSAYHLARAVETVARAGKERYPLPMLVNCWLNKPEDAPGDYPSGGPVARMQFVWRFCAPSIDVFCPDIYVPNFCDVCDAYAQNDNPLFIPECATHSYAAVRMVYVIGHYHALGYSPFGFEDMGQPFTAEQGFLFGMDVTDPALKTPQSAEDYAFCTDCLKQMMPLIAERYGTKDLQAVCSERPECSQLNFGMFEVIAEMQSPFLRQKNGVCLGIKIAENECYLLASGCVLDFCSLDPERPYLDILDFEEGCFRDGQWHVTRRLNGDEAAVAKRESFMLLRVRVHIFR